MDSTDTRSPPPSDREAEPGERARRGRRPTESRRAVSDLEVALYLTLASAILYALTARPDWNFDTLRFAEWTQSGELAPLLRPYHVLGNLLPLAVYRGLRAVGYGGGSLPILTGVSVAGAAGAVGLTFLTGRKFGGTRVASAAAAGVLGASYGVWGAGSAAGVYGVALFVLALGWFAAAKYVRHPGPRRAAVLGLTAALAVAGSRGNVLFVIAVAVLMVGMALPGSTRRKRSWRARGADLGVFLLTAVGTAAVAAAILVAVTDRGFGSIFEGVDSWFDFLAPFSGPSGSPDLVYGRLYATIRSVAGWPIPPSANELFPFELSQFSSRIAAGLAGGLLLATVIRGTTLLARAGRPTVIGAALGVHATLALVVAAVNSPSRVDHATLALVPLALLWPAAGPIVSRRKLWRGRAAMAVVVALGLVGWNLVAAVLPGVQEAVRRDAAIEGIVRVAPTDSVLLLSPQTAPRAAYRGMDASTGTALLLERVTFPNPFRGIRSFLRENEDRSVFVSSRAFDSAPQGRGFIAAVWSFLERCCAPRSEYRFVTSAGPEVLYRLAIDPARLAATPGDPPE